MHIRKLILFIYFYVKCTILFKKFVDPWFQNLWSYLNISGFFQNFYQNAVDMVKNLPSSSIISSMLALGDDGGVSSLAIFFARALFSVILNLREFQKTFFLAPRFDFCFGWNSITRLVQIILSNYFTKPSLF